MKRRIVRWLVPICGLAAGLVVPFLVVAQTVLWFAPDDPDVTARELNWASYATLGGLLAGFAGMITAGVLVDRWLRRH